MLKLWQLLPYYLVLSSVYAIPCKIRVPEDVPEQTPVILKDNELFKPNNKETNIEDGKSITLFCAGQDNKVKDPYNKDKYLNQAVTLTCNNGRFRHKGKEYRLRDMECKTVPSSELIETRTSCANGAGQFYKVGFTYNNKFLEILTICFNKATQHTVYSRNIIKSNLENVRMKRVCNTPFFSSDGMNFQPNNYYKVSKEIIRFKTLFGDNQPYLKEKGSFLSRGHLAPSGDYTFCYEQFATYYFANCAPEWQQVNAGNWADVEKATRQLAINTDILTFTSSFGALELPMPQTSRMITIYLDQTRKLVAPKWYYKVVMNPNWNMDVVFITLNNPFATVGREVEFCRNICGNIRGLNSATFRDASRGYTFCCELKDFWATAGLSTSRNPYYDLETGWRYK
ncbi:uncharacterized protein LOC128919796 [Zeugodacus cucurbitae]|uniref:uncharacterized protein LOC128919796 n=1 Tax=Zeugodacus cucurbitae TaxID=28588 RepID=UPI0023D940ED|nr:uncharacterized protein LOC128919796 [Zeugodacus cucurbitae]